MRQFKIVKKDNIVSNEFDGLELDEEELITFLNEHLMYERNEKIFETNFDEDGGMATVTLEKLDDNLFEINADYEVKEV
jgi:hypothetical protein